MSWVEDLERFNNKGIPKTLIEKKNYDMIRDIKLQIISLAYTPNLSASDLIELASILSTISNMKPVKKKGL